MMTLGTVQLSGEEISRYIELIDKNGVVLGEGVLTHLEHKRDLTKIRLFKVGNFNCWILDQVTVKVYPGTEKL